MLGAKKWRSRFAAQRMSGIGVEGVVRDGYRTLGSAMSFRTAYTTIIRFGVWGVLLIYMSSWARSAAAVEDCADTPQKLVQYLNKSETITGSYKIKIVQGQYILPGPSRQWLMTAAVTLEGGYAPMCQERTTFDSAQTIVDSSNMPLGPSLLSNALAIDGLTFKGGSHTEFSMATDDSSSLRITHVRFTNTIPKLDIQDGTLAIDNVLADHAPFDPIDHCAFNLDLFGNSVVKMKFASVASDSSGDVCVFKGSSGAHNNVVNIYNSILWSGLVHLSGADTAAGDALNVNVTNSLFNGTVTELGQLNEYSSLHADPLWTNPAAGQYELQIPPNPISPAINVGALGAQLPGGLSASDTDIAGNPRQVGSAPDMGAYESSVDDGAVFTVTTTTDCSTPLNQPSCGSLRDAVARAASPTSTSPVKTVDFAIVDASNHPVCPAKIHINSGLPDITTHVVIDGYSQGSIDQSDPPLSWPNDDPTFFNANLCVEVLGPGSSYGLRVPSGSDGSLTLRGVALGGFAQGVMLAGGANHQIAGNQFGGLTSGFSIYGFSNAGVRVETGAPVIIGGDNRTDRNVFLNANSADNSNAAGVVIGYGANGAQGTCQIVGNLFGISPDGTSADPNNENGVLINGNGCAVRGNYLAGNIKDAIHLLGGSHNVIQNNLIGPRITPGTPFFYNPGFGIHVTNGANDNIIGAGEGFVGSADSYENTITQMNAGGIVVANSTGNTIRGNSIYFNGNDVGLNLDLGGDGPTANDAGDADGGPGTANDLMNYPVPNSVVWGDGGTPQPGFVALTVRGQLDTQAGFYQIDAYYDIACSATGRGGGTWVGGAPYTAFFTGTGAFEVPVSIPFLSYDSKEGRVSVTATQLGVAHESTSEFSECLPVDTIFANDFER